MKPPVAETYVEVRRDDLLYYDRMTIEWRNGRRQRRYWRLVKR